MDLNRHFSLVFIRDHISSLPVTVKKFEERESNIKTLICNY